MGRGDKRTKKGKIFAGSFGNARRKKSSGYVVPTEETPKESTVKVATKKKAAPVKENKEETTKD